MTRRRAAIRLALLSGAALALSIPFGPAIAARYRVLYSFTGKSDGGVPTAGLIVDQVGNLYGTTFRDGPGGGVAFRFSPHGNYTVLHGFRADCSYPSTVAPLICAYPLTDGAFPEPGLILDPHGNLYGTTWFGGPANDGVVYRINTDGSEQVVHAFTGGKDGFLPNGNLMVDGKGNLYGTTFEGGGACTESYCGTVFKIAPDGTETVLHAFAGGADDGAGPNAGLISDNKGVLYGTTGQGGSDDAGTIFSITPDGAEKMLYAFSWRDLNHPTSPLILDKKHNLLGTTFYYQNTASGGIFELHRDGNWNRVYTFQGDAGGVGPTGIIRDTHGNLFGTAGAGGMTCGEELFGCGVVFQIAPDGTETILHDFGQTGGDGMAPNPLVVGRDGRFYGTTSQGGEYGFGTIYTITP
jgi:uncharacterized repeat protein (TIGR03803 family)